MNTKDQLNDKAIETSDTDLTYQLDIKSPPNLILNKEEVIEFLESQNISSFVEGSVDNILLDDNSDAFSNYETLERNLSAISVFKYSSKELENLKQKLEQRFKDSIVCKISSIKTQSWKTGWKDSFKPIKTQRFYIYPPWEEITDDKSLISIKIDPGMAFGTGQHPTSILCLEAIENFYNKNHNKDNNINNNIKHCLDIGTGTGILAIALKKLYPNSSVLATDIDEDAINASKINALANTVDIKSYRGSIPDNILSSYKFDIVVANILAPVLKQLIIEVNSVLKKDSIFIISGILQDDIEEIAELYSDHGLKLEDKHVKNSWACCTFKKE